MSLRNRELGFTDSPESSSLCSVSGGGGGGSQGNQGAGSLGIIPALLGSLVGQKSRARQGALGFGKGDFNFDVGQLDPSTFNAQGFFGSQLAEGGFDLGDAFGGLQGAVSTGAEAARTGLVDDTISQFKNIFSNDILPDIQNQLGSQGLNVNDSDFGASVAREIGRGSAGIANLAADRRLAASQAFPSFLQSLPGAEAGVRESARNRDSGAQAFGNLLGVAGIGTQGQGTGQSRSKGGGQAGVLTCWVAAEYFDRDTIEWHNARRFLMEDLDIPGVALFRRLYARYGEQLAAQVRARGWLRSLLRPLFLWAEAQGRESQ
jgi:hypothetical protein